MTVVGGQAAEQIIAGVVLSERLSVTMYGAIHRAQWAGQRNMRGLVIDSKLLELPAFRMALDDGGAIAADRPIDHPHVVPTITVETNGPDVVVVTRGVGRYVTVQDLITAAGASRATGGKLPREVAATIGKSVVEALAAAHARGVVHGAVHPRSVLVDEDGAVRLSDFVVGRALTTAVAQGADAALWRGLAGYLAPELVIGEEPTPAADVFAAGAMLFTMLSGEVPPGTLHVSPAVERLVQRALDTDLVRRYKTAADLLENLLEAFEDDRWELADRGAVIKAAGLSQTDGNIDDATEDLLASLGSLPGAVQVTPIRPSIDLRAAAVAARHGETPTSQNRLDALLADLDDGRDHTQVEQAPAFKRDPISELIHMDPRRQEAIVQIARPGNQGTAGNPAKPARRVPSLDDPDDDFSESTPLPPPRRDSDSDIISVPPVPYAPSTGETGSAALSALAGLDEPARRVSDAADQAAAAAVKLEQVAARVEAAASRTASAQRPVARPIAIEPVPGFDLDAPPPRLRSRAFGVVLTLVVIGGGIGIWQIYRSQQARTAAGEQEVEARRKQADERTITETESLADAGALTVTSTPAQAGVWLRIGRTPVTTMRLQANSTHELAFVLDGYQLGEAQVVAASWSGPPTQAAKVEVLLQPIVDAGKPGGKGRGSSGGGGKGSAAPTPPTALPLQPTAVHAASSATGAGPIALSTTPRGAEAYLYVGLTGSMRFNQLIAGRDYEIIVVKDGYRPVPLTITADDWRAGSDRDTPIDRAKKKSVIELSVTLEPVGGPGATPTSPSPTGR